MPILDRINGPADLRALDERELAALADEIRAFLITHVSRTGGHLGPNLGVVELTIALHRVFDSPHDPIVFDTGHQSYVHKILTGRKTDFESLRQYDGLSGYPSRAESEHDWVENSHASTSLSWADGMARAYALRGEDRYVVAVIGDGALTGGMAWEALNNIAVHNDLKLIVVVNDNGRSYTPTVGGLAAQLQILQHRHLAAVRTDRRYEQTLDVLKRGVSRTPLVGDMAYSWLHGLKIGLKDVLAPQGMFSDLGIKYIGPIDGHDVAEVERALGNARKFGGPVIVHCLTRKGNGFKAAEDHEEDRFHAVGRIDEHTGEPLSAVVVPGWTDVFADEMVSLAEQNPRLVALTAAMLHPVGLARMAAAFPDRVFDVGIAEQHAVTSAAGMAAAGLHPVIAVYSTFLNRAFDQVLMDVALHKQGVTFILDRSGVTGSDGASHNGMWDLAMLAIVPGLQLAAPRDGTRLREALRHAVSVDDAPTVIRYSKERVPADIPAVRQHRGLDILREDDAPRVLVVGHGELVGLALEVGERLTPLGITVSVVDPVWALPANPALVELAGRHDLVVSIEDGLDTGGLGSHLAHALQVAGVDTPVREFGIPQQFLHQGPRDRILADIGLTAAQVARVTTEVVARLDGTSDQAQTRADQPAD